MSDFFDDRRVVVACIIGIVVVLAVSIISITIVWQANLSGVASNTVENGNTNIEESSDIGKYRVVSISKEDQLKKYAVDLASKIEFSDIDAIYELLDPGYVEYFNITNEAFKAKLEGKGILGKKLDMTNYIYTTLNDMNVYSLKYTNSDKSLNGSINIIEKSPNNYTIAFDDFVAYNKEPREFIQDGLKFTIYDQAWFNTKYKLKATFKNLNESSYIVNSSRLYENNYIKLSNLSEVRTMSTVLAGDSIRLDKGAEMNYSLEFNISEFSFSTIRSFIIKDVKSVDTDISKDYEFTI
ncbi:MAG: hypothetical protein Q4D02_07880 [Clostridia bacterium]|nr:hypothetical protein [Clostridia bacterium]